MTGTISKVIVLDTDTDEADVKARGVPVTPTVRTAKGWHRYFAHPGGDIRNFAGKRPGLDLRGDGGSAITVITMTDAPTTAVIAANRTPIKIRSGTATSCSLSPKIKHAEPD